MSFFNKLAGLDELRFGLTRKLLSLLLVATGLASFFLPLVKTNPEVMNQIEWSPYEMATYAYQARLVRSLNDAYAFPVEIATVYLLLLLALYVIALSRSQRWLVHISVLGLGLMICGLTRAADSFELLFYQNYPPAELTPGKHVHFLNLMLILVTVLTCVLFVTVSESLDVERRPKLTNPDPVEPKEPEFIVAEFVEGKTDTAQPTPPMRLSK